MTPTIPMQVVERFHQELLSHERYLRAVIAHQGFSLKKIKQFKIGFDPRTKRIAIPIIENGVCYNIKLYSSKNSPKYLSYTDRLGRTYGKRRLWGESLIENADQILITAGEKDCIIARQYGFVAVTGTAGEVAWDNAWNRLFVGKTVYIVYDNDDAGRLDSGKVFKALSEKADVKVIDLSSVCIEEGEDLQDYFVKYKKTDTDLLQLLEES